ncbi:MAG TPA: dihydrofolate reductase [Lacunisphaera sp.]|jgi:dihydrofolate reductase
MPKPISLIVACTENRVIGSGRRLPFQIPEDKAWFAEKTAGCVVILGRISFEVWPSARTDGRHPVVVTRDPSLASGGVRIASTVTEALAIAQTLPGEIMVCGGARIYEETLPLAQRLFLTLVHAELAGDVKFPEWRNYPWRETWKRESQDANFRYTFSVLER